MNTGNNKFLSFSEKAVVIVFLYLCIQCSILGGDDPEKYSSVIRVTVSSYFRRNLHIRH